MVKNESRRVSPFVWLFLALSFVHFAAASWQSAQYGFVDLPIFVERTNDFSQGKALYPNANDSSAYEPAAAVYKFPPLFAVTLLPQVLAGLGQSIYPLHWAVHILLYLGALGLLVAALQRRFELSRSSALLVVGAVGLNFVPFFETLWRLQLETPILFLVALALWAEGGARRWLSGAALGVAAMLKVYPLFLLGWFVLRRSVRGVVAASIALIATFALGWWVIGSEQNLVYYGEILPRMMQELPRIDPENIALAKPLHVLVGFELESAKRVAQLIALSVVALGFLLLHGRPFSVRSSVDPFALLSVMICGLLMFMPNAWTNYLELSLIPIIFVMARCLEEPAGVREWAAAAAAFAFVLMLFFTPCGDPSTGWPCAQTPRFLAVATLPRQLHDLAISWKPLAMPLLTIATLLMLPGVPSRRASSAA